jgi:UDP-N-acetylglucosamine 4,6-dehydratase
MRVLITGGTGSLGRALVPRLLQTCERVVVFSRGEYAQARMHEELGDHANLRFFIGDIRDVGRLTMALYGIDTIVHAAALKRVDATADNPIELMKTNVVGTAHVVEAAIAAGVQRVLFISSDKACQPINAYGVSKAMAEQLIVRGNTYSYPQGTSMAVLRYGNCLGSRGSVIHLWRRQLSEGKPVTVTHPEMTRFWLTMDQAVDYIEDALAHLLGGEIIVPAELPGASMATVAEAMAPGEVHQIAGLRSGGEKAHEVLLGPEEIARTVRPIPGLYVVSPDPNTWGGGMWPGKLAPPDLLLSSERARRLSVEEFRLLLDRGLPMEDWT